MQTPEQMNATRRAFEDMERKLTAISGGLSEAKKPESEEPKALPWLDMSNWDNAPIPERKWAIRDRVPANQAGMFSGEGGTGKSIIELMKNVAHVAGKDWLGSMPEQGPAIYLGTEDTADEIHIRLAAIAEHLTSSFRNWWKAAFMCFPS
jgi:RecA-family ATPase